ncbi:TlpA family protein disulfide reductase [Mucilaginibacter conchicola]|uniref:TlpA family protein disulfide reductase n=1 Tax=Mucilaginibacter conchicola TaxID=2303333 RepID=A0A372NXE1_9SPHI|nr:TlpA disulfide reductase family protein [Mucilaginibacter conchicola]RFZ94339.1 TlpA family protein disulfide reductase [Mucilaginibacter conchicola]
MKKSTLNLFAIIILLMLPLSSIAQTTITTVIKSPIKIDSVSMDDVSTTEHYSFPFKDTLTFNFRKKDIDCYNIKYYVNNKRYKNQLWLNAGKISVNAHLTDTSHFIIDTVVNSPFYYHKLTFLKNIALLRKDSSAYNAALLPEIENHLEQTWSMYLALSYIDYNQNSKDNLLKLKAILVQQKTDFSWFMLYKIAIPRLNELLKVRSFNIAGFAFINRQGKTTDIKLQDYDYYLLDFWFLDCPPCRRDHMWISENLDKIAAQKVKVISIGTDKKELLSDWNKYLAQHKYTWDNYLEPANKKITEQLGISDYPSYVLLNSKGEIVRTANSVIDALQQFKIN